MEYPIKKINKLMVRRIAISISVFVLCIQSITVSAQDTLTVMAYNVLNYGGYPLCQGPNSIYHDYLRQIVAYANPDILGLEKMGAVRVNASDFTGNAPLGYGDSIVQYALDAAYPGRYAYCPFTNVSAADNMSLLFYDQNKLGFVKILCTYANVTDFNTYKLYYKDPNLATTHDTTFLYVTLNHDQSGNSSTIRDGQIAGEMNQIQGRLSRSPNMINMGDFNTRSTTEGCYQALVDPADTAFRYFDPPFSADGNFTYPANWDALPNSYTNFLTTSTRQSATVPNSCGTSGGAKSWYDHIFLSSWIMNNTNYIQYIPHSYHTLGNDGTRLSRSVNDNSASINASAPANVIDALFQMSNKYPVIVKLLATSNTTGTSVVDPSETSSVSSLEQQLDIRVINPVADKMLIGFPTQLMGQKVQLQVVDATGVVRMNSEIKIGSAMEQLDCNLPAGVYVLRITTAQGSIAVKKILKY